MTLGMLVLGFGFGAAFQRYMLQRRLRKLLYKIESVIFSKGSIV
jgi:hypothetical protein